MTWTVYWPGARPPADTLLPVMFHEVPDERGLVSYRLRPEVRLQVVAELRCPRKRHLVAVVVRTTHGLWLAWRSPFWVGFDFQGGYECAWHDPKDPQIVNAGCTCRTRRDGVTQRRTWIVPLYWLAEQHGVVLTRVERKTAVT